MECLGTAPTLSGHLPRQSGLSYLNARIIVNVEYKW